MTRLLAGSETTRTSLVQAEDEAERRNFKVERNTWRNAIDRCHNPARPYYRYYGARGVQVCERWRKSFEAFLADVGPRPSPAYSLDRYPDPCGNYEPGNVRWATVNEQNRNKRNNRWVEVDGRRQTVSEWARELGLLPATVTRWLQRGRTVEEILAGRLRRRRKRNCPRHGVPFTGGYCEPSCVRDLWIDSPSQGWSLQ